MRSHTLILHNQIGQGSEAAIFFGVLSNAYTPMAGKPVAVKVANTEETHDKEVKKYRRLQASGDSPLLSPMMHGKSRNIQTGKNTAFIVMPMATANLAQEIDEITKLDAKMKTRRFRYEKILGVFNYLT